MIDRVREILRSENIETDDDAVQIIAREAAGSMRDALTLLDQLVAYSGSYLKGDDVARALGVANHEHLFETAHSILMGDGAKALLCVHKITEYGTDPLHFARQLTQFLRDLVVLRIAPKEMGLVQLVSEERTRADMLANSIEPLELQRAFSAMTKVVDDVGRALTPKTVLEMGLVRIATRPPLREIGELLRRLEALERGVDGGGGGRGGRGGSERSGKRGPSSPSANGATQSASSRGTQSRSEISATGVATSTGSHTPSTPVTAATSHRENPTTVPGAVTPRTVEPSTTEVTATASMNGAPMNEASNKSSTASAPPNALVALQTPAAEAPSTSQDSVRASNSEESQATVLRRAALQEWERLVDRLRDGKPALAAILEHGHARFVDREKVVVAYQDGSFYGRQAEAPDSIAAIADVALELYGTKPEVEIRFEELDSPSSRTLAELTSTRREARLAAKRRAALEHPCVQEIMEVFPEARGKVDVQVVE